MPKDYYPRQEHLGLFLRSTGLPALQNEVTLSLLDLNAQIDASIAEWERRTRWVPFLATTQTRWFDPPGANRGQGGVGYGGLGGLGGGSLGGSNLLFLDAGLLSVTSVATHLTDTDMAGTVQLEKRDFWLSPTSAPSAGMPYMAIKFRWPVYGDPQSIQVVGSWGRGATLPDNGWNAILQYAASLIMPQVAFLVNGGLESWTEAGVTEKYAKILEVQVPFWQTYFDRQVELNTRRSL